MEEQISVDSLLRARSPIVDTDVGQLLPSWVVANPFLNIDRDKDRSATGMSRRCVAVCVCTRRRPKMLRACLDSLIAQVAPKGWQIALIVVENNESPCCSNIVAEVRKGSPFSVEYVNEKEIGIPFARNRAIAAAGALGTEWIAFIDDDEVAEPNWLVRLCARAEQPGVDVVQGPVRYEYPTLTPDWMPHRSITFRESGQTLRTAFTNNVMFRRALTDVAELGLSFDTHLRFSGGSDTDFFNRAVEQGAHIVWEQAAVVSEYVPDSRVGLGWQLKRAFRVATNASESDLRRRGFLRTLARRMPKNVLRLIKGAVLLPLVALWPLGALYRRLAFDGMKSFASALGGISGFTSFRLEPYRFIDGE